MSKIAETDFYKKPKRLVKGCIYTYSHKVGLSEKGIFKFD